MGLAAVDDLDLDARGAPRAIRRARASASSSVGVVAVVDGEELEAGRQASRAPRGPPGPGRCRPRRRPSSGSSTIVWPFFTLRPPTVASRTASVTCSVWTARPALGHVGSTFVGGADGRVEREQRRDALGRVAGRHDVDRPVRHELGDLAGGQDHVGVVGQDAGARRRASPATASSSSPVRRVGALATADDRGTRRTPEVRGQCRRRIDAPRPSTRPPRRRRAVGEPPSAGRPRRPQRRRRPRRRRRPPRRDRAPVPAGLADEGRGPRLADVVGLVVEVLDADPADRVPSDRP